MLNDLRLLLILLILVELLHITVKLSFHTKKTKYMNMNITNVHYQAYSLSLFSSCLFLLILFLISTII